MRIKFEKNKDIIVFHPFLFAVYLILGTYSQNASQVPFSWVTRPLILLLLITAAIYVFLWLIFKNFEYAGFVSTLILNWLFLGHLYRFFLDWSSFWKTPIGILLAILLISLPIALLASRWLWRKLSSSRSITKFLNVTSLALILYPIWTTIGMVHEGNAQMQRVKEMQADFNVSLTYPSALAPDIYLIIVDGYGRSDFLQEVYRFDNSQFVNLLKEMGFYVAESATSNYPQTQLSLSSMLNLQYLNETLQDFGSTDDRTALYELVQHPAIRSLLEDQGYSFIAMPSAVLTTQIRDADVYLNPTRSNVNEFEAFLLSLTVIGILAESWDIDLPVMGYELHRKYVLFSLENMRDVSVLSDPKFVFVHIMLPHPPFIFDSQGNFIPPDRPYIMFDGSLFPGSTEEYQLGYTAQLSYLNQKLSEMISDILSLSASPPIIILQGDHGPGIFFNLEELDNTCLKERYSILNAYFFPDKDYSQLYPTITPVNSFRIILNQYFDAEMEVLDDKNYYSTWSAPYIFNDVSDQAQFCRFGTKD